MAFRTCFFVAPGDRFSRISRAYSLKKYQVNIRVQRALPVPLCGSFGLPLKGDVLLKTV